MAVFSSKAPQVFQQKQNSRLANQLLLRGTDTSAVRTPLEGIGRASQAILGAYMQKQAADKADARQAAIGDTLAQALQAQPVVATPPTQDSSAEFVGGDVTTTPGTPGQSRNEVMAGILGGNPDTAPFALQMKIQQQAQQDALAAQLAGEERQFGRAKDLAAHRASLSRGSNLTTAQRNFEQAQNDPGFAQFLKDTGSENTPASLQEFNLIKGLNERAGAGDPVAKEQLQLWFANKRNPTVINLGDRQVTPNPVDPTKNIAERAVNLKPGETPEVKGEQVQAQEQAKVDVAQAADMPGQRASIATKSERLPILKGTIAEIKELSKGWATSGAIGQVAGLSSSSDQYVLNRKMEQVKSAVGLEELIRTKSAGATFGSLTENEMTLLISSVGALDSNLPPEILGPTLDTVVHLYEKGLERAKSDFAERYPDAKRPWESASPPASATPGNVQEGKTATNPKTGAKIIFRNGRWESIQ